jgi:hypothetical protein
MSRSIVAMVLVCAATAGCGDDDSAVERGVGAACSEDADCTEPGQACLTQFKGGMCGIEDCSASSECPAGSVCVDDPDLSQTFCLLTCVEKVDCNVHRPAADEANCSSTLNQLDPPDGGGSDPKVCRPPTGSSDPDAGGG